MSQIIKKTVCVLLALVMFISASAVTFAENADAVLAAAVNLIISNEGVYTSVLANDNGAVSIGKVGWHATRALDLLQTIVAADSKQAAEILGETLLNEIQTAKSWNTRIFTAEEKAVVEKLLGTPQSKKAQDAFAQKDIQRYITHGMSLGLRDGKVLVYFADLENQMGDGGAERVVNAAVSAAGSASRVTLDAIYNAALADKIAGSSPTRRKTSYNYCKKLSFDGGDVLFAYKTGKYTVTASSLRVRSGPGTSYDTVASAIPNGTSVAVTAVSGEWGKITYKGVTGWICLLYADHVDDSVQTQPLAGDVNGSGKVEAADARLALRFSAKLVNLSAEQQKTADMNKDGKVTAADARIILQKAAGLIK